MHNDGYFSHEVAARYDDSAREMFAPDMVEPVVDFLLERSGGGRALEFGIGTGRIALPLARRGIEVCGVDVSQPMLDELAKKPGSNTIDVVLGDFATTRAPGSFSIVYLVYNTIMNLTTQADQVACFRNAAAHLDPGDRFVIEVGVPDLRRLPPGRKTSYFTPMIRDGASTSTTSPTRASSRITSKLPTTRSDSSRCPFDTYGRPSST